MKTASTNNGQRRSRHRAAEHEPHVDSVQLPPQNLDAERGLLCSLLIDATKLDDVSGIVTAEDFYLTAHRELFRTIQRLVNTAKPVDHLTVAEELNRAGQFEEIGGVPYLLELSHCEPHAAHAVYYAKIIAGTAQRRALRYAAVEMIRDAHDAPDIDDALAQAESRLHGIIEQQVGSTVTKIGDKLIEVLERLDSPESPGIATGFCDLDRLIGGFKPGQLIVLAARTSVGKSAFAANIAQNVADDGVGVLYVSLEMSATDLILRFLSRKANVALTTLENPKGLAADERERLVESANRLHHVPLFIDDTTPRTITQIAAVARLERRRHQVGLVIVDYLQLIQPEDRKIPREQQVAEMSRSLKTVARSLQVPVVALAQLNRGIEGRDDKRPRLSDLRESGAIEQDADLVLFLDRPATYNDKADPGEAKLYVSKHRNGRTGIVPLTWSGKFCEFCNAALDYQSVDAGFVN